MLAPERPGCGRSDPQPGRTLLDWPRDVRALADALGVERFAVAGVSGGGPYAAACAWALPERVSGAAILSGIGPADRPGETRDMLAPNRIAIWMFRHSPRLARALLSPLARQLRNPERALAQMARSLPEPDRRIVAERHQQASLAAQLRESVARGNEGLFSDFEIFSRPWGFPLAEIRVPVHLWHGELDRNCPIAMARRVAAEIPGCRATFAPGAGHLFTLQRIDEVLEALGL